jgi:hypothetical protein
VDFLSSFLRYFGFHLTILFPAYLASGIPLVENIERASPGLSAILLMQMVGKTPVANARKYQKYYGEPQEPTPGEIPVVPVIVSHMNLLISLISVLPGGESFHLRQRSILA